MKTSISPTSACTQCGKPFSPNDFYTIKRKYVIGYRSICKDCDNAASKIRYKRGKKKCVYPDCETMIAPGATYCTSHFRLTPGDKERRAAKIPPHPPRSPCAYPECEVIPSKGATYCREHANKRKWTLATRTKMSNSAKIRANTPEGRAVLSRNGLTSFKGRTHTDVTRTVIRQKRALQVITAESIEKGCAKRRGRPSWNRGGTKPQEEKDRISATLLSRHDHLSRRAKERYDRETDEQKANRLNNWIQAGQDAIERMFAYTSIELFIAQYLDSLGIEYETQKKISYYIVDFCIPSRKVIIEAQGCYWHGCLQCGYNEPQHIAKRAQEQVRTERLEKKGYTVIMVWEHDIRKVMQDSTYSLHLHL